MDDDENILQIIPELAFYEKSDIFDMYMYILV